MPTAAAFPTLYPILDAGILPPAAAARNAAIETLVSELAQAGVSILQYRNKRGDETQIIADAHIMRKAAGTRIKLILNDYPALVARIHFDGVHVGQQDLAPQQAREFVGPTSIVGISTHNEEQLRKADTDPVDYIAIGPVFATSSKENPDPVVGLAGVRLARSLTHKPLVAIGGISLETAAQVRAAGADSIAVISAIFAPGMNAGKMAEAFLKASK